MVHHRATRRSLIVGLSATALGGCEWMVGRKVGQYSFRLRMGLIVGGRERVIESVRAVEHWEHHSWVPTANSGFGQVRGQATPIEIANRTLFLTMAGYQQFNGMAMSYYGDGPREPSGIWTPYLVYQDRGLEAPHDWSQHHPGLVLRLASHELPVLVTFEDNADPQSIRLVRPEELSTLFPEVAFGRSTVEWTRARPTRTDIRKRLPWVYAKSGDPGYGRLPHLAPFVEAGPLVFGRS